MISPVTYAANLNSKIKKFNIKVFIIFIRQKLAHLFYDKESWLFFLVEEVHGLRLNDESCSFGAQI